MRLHVLSMPHTETTDEWSACAYTQRTRDFATFMKCQGYDVILYGGEQNQAEVTEHVCIASRADQAAWFPGFTKRDMFDNFNSEAPGWKTFNARCATEIRKRAQKQDVICITMGVAQKDAADQLADLGLLTVETGIGYAGVFAQYRVFESAAWRHFLAAKEPNDNLRWFDTVIPRGYIMDQFPLGKGGNDYLFVGRLISRKGAQIASEACERLGVRLLVAGQGVASHKNGEYLKTTDGTTLKGNVHYLGMLSPSERAFMMGSVRAVFMPTWYLEPGGGVAIESQLCGTPVITTPYGAMTETVLEGGLGCPGVPQTGFHCSTLSEFVSAAEHAQRLDRYEIRKSAEERFSSRVVSAKYHVYFKRLQTLYGEGWYAL